MAVLGSHVETRRQRLHLQLRSGQLHIGKRVGAHGSLHHPRYSDVFGFLERIPRQDTHSQYTSVQYSLFTSAARTSHALLKGQHGSSNQGLHSSFVRSKRICHLVSHMSHTLLFSHLPLTTSTSSSSFTLPSTMTPEQRTTIGTTRSTPRKPSTSSTSPRSPSRQAAPSRITLA